MASALILAEDRGRKDGRWVGRDAISTGGNSSRGWLQRLSECGAVLDYAPELADQVVRGSLPLKTAYGEAEARKRSAEAEKYAERARAVT